jgi:pimeloyl-ACP methyl ester carboxylesterase
MPTTVLIALLLMFLVSLACPLARDQEREELTDSARTKAPGKFIRLPDGLVHYELAGPADGKTVVLVHGFSTYFFTWDAAFQALVDAGFRVLRYDLYGRGYSDRPAAVYDKDLFDRQLMGLLAVLDIQDRVDLVGNSMGGLITTTFAARHPERVRTLTLIDPAFFFLERVPFPLGIPLVGDHAGRMFAVPFIAKAQTRDFKHPERFPDYDRTYRLQMRYRGFSRAILSTIKSLPRWDAQSDLRRVSKTDLPVLLVWGREDRTVPFAVSDKVRSILPRSEFHAIDDAAHMPHYERPEAVNPVIIRFLAPSGRTGKGDIR